MLLGGDEIGRTQGGNNNAYCQDNEISWFDWEHMDGELLDFTQRLIDFRKRHPVFRRRRFFHDAAVEMGWFRPDGAEMTDEDWSSGFAKSIGVSLNGDAIPRPTRAASRQRRQLPAALQRPLRGAGLPRCRTPAERWLRVLDTADAFNEGDTPAAGETDDGRGAQHRRLPADGLMALAIDVERREARDAASCCAATSTSPRAPELRERADRGDRATAPASWSTSRPSSFLDSAGLGILVGGLKRARAAGGDLVLVCSGRERPEAARDHRARPRVHDPRRARGRARRLRSPVFRPRFGYRSPSKACRVKSGCG